MFSHKCIYKHLLGSKIFINIKTKPGSKREGISSINDDEICVNIRAPPVEGKANSAIIKYFSDIFDLSKSSIAIEKGETNKNKIISVDGSYTEEEVFNILKENTI
jgi:uncharacterized protein (TIGR00251 family)